MLSWPCLLSLASSVLFFLPAPVESSYYRVDGYLSPGYIMKRIVGVDVPGLMRWCNKEPRCQGFTSDGSMRKAFEPRSQWIAVPPETPGEVFSIYIKDTAWIPPDRYVNDFEEYDGYTVDGHTFTHATGSLNDLRLFCKPRVKCFGFNPDGNMKRFRVNQKDWRWVGVGTSTFYVKGHYPSRMLKSFRKPKYHRRRCTRISCRHRNY